MAAEITGIVPHSPAHRAHIRVGDQLLTINGHEIRDILDFRFYETETRLELCCLRENKLHRFHIHKGQYDEIGLEFESFLMDRQQSCCNKCVFCFIDQLPKGLRKTLYFKDDDARMSFLFGNYITLTNLRDEDIERIIQMHISPVNVSVHTTNPELRVRMMANKRSGESLRHLWRLAEAGVKINTQIVLCRHLNDGAELTRTLNDLCKYYPSIQSIAVVPSGLTKFREGLYPLERFDRDSAREAIEIIHTQQEAFIKEHGERIAYPSDEFFLKAEYPIPDEKYYGDFDVLENGVGMLALLRSEFMSALSLLEDGYECKGKVSFATGAAAGDFIGRLIDEAAKKCNNLNCTVYTIINHFFGEDITVAGLITGQDLVAQLKDKPLGDVLYLPSCMLRHERDIFLDDMSLEEVEEALNIHIELLDSDGGTLLDAAVGDLLECP